MVLDWQMSHNIACIGNGQVWPSLVFTSEGDRIEVSVQATESVPAEPISYRQNFTRTIAADDFESEVDRFIKETIERTTSRVSMDTDLPELWKEVLEERNDPEATELRKLEAYLGYDAGEAPEELLDNMQQESEKYGSDAVQGDRCVLQGTDSRSHQISEKRTPHPQCHRVCTELSQSEESGSEPSQQVLPRMGTGRTRCSGST